MKRTGLAGFALTALLFLTLVAPAAAAQAGSWVGTTSQAKAMGFTVTANPDPVITDFSFDFRLLCEQTGRVVDIGVGFGGVNIPITNNQFSNDSFGLGQRIVWGGQFTTETTAQGAVSAVFAALTPSMGVERCFSFRRTWQASVIGETARSARPDYYFQISRDASGQARVSVQSFGRSDIQWVTSAAQLRSLGGV
jgi:hypothetical protein